mmetsp:Transcript_48901/g.78134  ORF Transcript_48901/g.78134 Transcript_48901/m.78134 type:complete len:232 (+) Transcript_48901:39-734(+)|eukprot:CAMPEP_0197055772 /NCGR_PEP_ID=MMETSP1384-20130603/72823_1 /TAXON_ID=29189 /ORGANISM="Ammonia sp." /LENGTH=231 /DNA_ID=CAMNT_0042489457 /DNA_START=32 /DNA_END=727 /DNA_ORIENTATION=+
MNSTQLGESTGSKPSNLNDIIVTYTTQTPYMYYSILSAVMIVLCLMTCCICCVMYRQSKASNRRDSEPQAYALTLTVTGHSVGNKKHSLQIVHSVSPQVSPHASPLPSPQASPRQSPRAQPSDEIETRPATDEDTPMDENALPAVNSPVLNTFASEASTEYTHEWYDGTLPMDTKVLAAQTQQDDSEERSTTEDLRNRIETKLQNTTSKHKLKIISEALDSFDKESNHDYE